MDWAARLRRLAVQADTLVDIARTLMAERDQDGDSDVVVWAQAARATIASHDRDLATVMPWAPDLAAALTDLASAAPAARRVIEILLASSPTPTDLADRCQAAIGELATLRASLPHEGAARAGDVARLDGIIERLERSSAASRALVGRLLAVARVTRELFDAMQFGFLFDPMRKIFSIGYRVTDGSLDPGEYDLLASEARLASFIAIAKGEVPASHWFRLGRPMTPVGLGSALVSWSGSMFEYLMPALVMHSPPGSLLDQTYHLVVHRQMSYGAARGIPWGISESAYNVRDLDLTYQYSNFGVPGLGLERGLAEDLVVAPYASALAAMVDPVAAARNLSRLDEAGARGAYGFYEALDYTRSRLPEGSPVAIVRTYMAHHQGMTLVALLNVLRDGVMRARFHGEPIVQATDLLLQERAPRDVAVVRPPVDEVQTRAHIPDFVEPVSRQYTSPHQPMPRTHLLSNGRYVVMLTVAGSGYSRCADLAITRWREDATRDAWGTYIFLRDVHSGDVWSAGYQPTGVEPDAYRATFFEDRAELHRRDGTITTTLEVLVSPQDDVELRRVAITNLGGQSREIEVTSYAEIVLAPPAADAAHPAFSNLFVQTEWIADLGALLGHAPAPVTRGAARLGGPHRGRRGSVRRGHAVRDRPGAVPGAGSRDPHADGGHRRPPPVQHRGLGPRSDLQPPAPRSPRTGRERPPPLLHPRRPVARGGGEAGRRVSRPGRLRAHGHPGLDAGASPVAPSRNRGGRGPPVPDPGQSDPLLGPGTPALGGRAEAQRGGALGPLGPPDLGRPSDRPGPDRRARGSRNRPTAPPRSRVLAPEGAGRRSRHPERAGGVLYRAAPDVPGGAGPDQPVRGVA